MVHRLFINCRDDHDRYSDLNLREAKPGFHTAEPVEMVYIKFHQNNNLASHEDILPNQRDISRSRNFQALLVSLMRWFPSQDIHFALILWYLAKTIPTFYELSLFSSRISSKYFDGDINLVHAL